MRRESKQSILSRPALVAAVILLAAPAEGSLVRYDFSGHITEETTSGPSSGWREFTGTLIYDDAIVLGDSRVNRWGQNERPYVGIDER